MPILPQIAANGQAVGQVGRQHPIRRPRIYEPCVDGIGAVRHPDGAEMGPVLVGGIGILLKLKPPRSHPLQEPPVGFVAEFREVADRILQLGNRRALAGADAPDDSLVDAVPGLHYRPTCGGILAVALDAHVGGQAGAVPIQIEFPPPMVTPISVLVISVPYPIFLPPWTPNAPACRTFYRSAGD